MKNNLLSLLDKLFKKLELQKRLPDLNGRCNCGYAGYFKFKATQNDAKGNFKFNLYDCPKCKSTISGNTIVNNLYKNEL